MAINQNALLAAQIAGQNLGIAPALLYGQFVAEGTTNGAAGGANGNNNYGNIMPSGTLATYSSPQAFASAYTSLIQSNFPNAVNSGSNVQAFVSGLTNNSGQIYYGTGITQSQYANNVQSGANGIANVANNGVGSNSWTSNAKIGNLPQTTPNFSLTNLPAFLTYEAKNIALFSLGFIFIYIVLKNSVGVSAESLSKMGITE